METLEGSAWDVVVEGTGVKLSLLAAALSRSGKKVLQLDPNDHYGSHEACYSLDEFESWVSSLPASPSADCPFSSGSFERHGELRSRAYTISLAPHIVYWDSALLEFLRDVRMTQSFTWQAVGSWWIWLSDADMAERPAEGGGVSGALVDAGAKAVKVGGAIRKKSNWNKNRRPASTPAAVAEALPPEAALPAASEPPSTTTLRVLSSTLREVPCTLEDVAFSSSLYDRDRGYLGGFLRFVSKSLGAADANHRLLAECADTPFTEFMRQNFPVPLALAASLHSLTLLPTPPSQTPLKSVAQGLRTHLSSLGRIPDIRSSAALTLAYGGSAELPQVFSRATAVAGGINVLGTSLASFSHSAKSAVIATASSAGPSQTISVQTPLVIKSAPTRLGEGKQASRGVYLLPTPLSQLFEKKHSADAIAPAAVVVTFPAGSLGDNEVPVYALVRAARCLECPEGESLAYLFAEEERGKGAEAWFDEAVRRTAKAAGGTGAEWTMKGVWHVAGGEGGGEWGEQKDGVIMVEGMARDMVFDKNVVAECRGIWEKLVGEEERAKGFCVSERKEDLESEE